MKAERWQDGDRPIGRPERNDAGTPRRRDAAAVLPLNASSAASAPFVFEDDFTLTEDLTTPAFGESSVATERAEIRAAVGVDARRPRSVAPLARRSVPEELAPSAPAITFEEPSEVSSIRDLAIDPHVAALTGDDPLAAERYRTLAVKLLNLADRRKLKTVLITSAEAGEGKTTVATGAAWSLAKHPERRVLLIDASLTASSVDRMLGIDAKRGWLNLVEGSCELKQALIRLDPKGLYVLTPGPLAVAQSADALSSRLEDLIAELAGRFDLVIVDSGSILETPETQRLATVLDGVVIVARASQTHHSKVTAARKLIPKEKRLGVVLNESEADAELSDRRSKGNSLVGRLFGRKR